MKAAQKTSENRAQVLLGTTMMYGSPHRDQRDSQKHEKRERERVPRLTAERK